MQVPLPSTIKGSKTLPKETEYLANLLNIDGKLVSRPGMRRITASSGELRGAFEYEGVFYSVFGNTLYADTELNAVGTINGSGPIKWAKGFNHVVMVTGSTNYTLSNLGALGPITDPDLPACADVTRADGRFVYIPLDGSPALFSDVGFGDVVGSLSFFDAEALPDDNRMTITLRNDVFIGGDDSFERFRNQGTNDAPFVRAQGTVTDVGYVSGKIRSRDSVLFLGRDRENGYAFYGMVDGIPQIISSSYINECLNLDYTLTELKSCVAQRFNWRGVDCYCFSLPDRDFVFYQGKWSYFDSGITTPTGLEGWGFRHATLFNGKWYAQGSDGLYELTTDHEDAAGVFSRRIRTFARNAEELDWTISYLELLIAQGGTQKGSVALSLSLDGQIWSAPWYVETGDIGDREKRLRWQAAGGIGRSNGYLGIIIYCADDIEFAADNMVIS